MSGQKLKKSRIVLRHLGGDDSEDFQNSTNLRHRQETPSEASCWDVFEDISCLLGWRHPIVRCDVSQDIFLLRLLRRLTPTSIKSPIIGSFYDVFQTPGATSFRRLAPTSIKSPIIGSFYDVFQTPGTTSVRRLAPTSIKSPMIGSFYDVFQTPGATSVRRLMRHHSAHWESIINFSER